MSSLARFASTLLLFLSMSSWAQTSIKVQVRQKGSGDPLSRVEIKVGEQRFYTDPQGEVTIPVPDGDGGVEIYRAEYQGMSMPYATIRNKKELTVYLYPAVPTDNEIVVSGTRRPEASRKQISVQEAARVAPGGDPAQVPRLLPGVQSSPFQPDIVVRGSGPNDSKYFIDLWEVPFIFHRVGNISIMPDNLLSDVEFSAGGFGAQFGNATGGIITLQTKSEQPDRETKTEIRTNIPVYSGIFHQRKIDKSSSIALSARQSYLDQILPRVLPKTLDLSVVPSFGDMHIFYLQNRDDGHLKFLGLYAYDGLKLLFPNSAADNDSGKAKFNLRNAACLAGFEWKKIINKDWTLTIAPEILRTLIRFEIQDNYVYIRSWGPVMQAEAIRRLGGKNKLYIGTRPEFLQGSADVQAPIIDQNDPFFDPEDAPKRKATVTDKFYNLAGWVATEQNFDQLSLTPGVRVSYNSQIRKNAADPRINVRYDLNEAHAVKTAIGQYSQAPQFQDTDKTFGNPNLNFIRSNHYVLGFESKWTEKWNTDFQVFYKESYDLVTVDPVKNKANAGSLISSGFETFIRRNLTQRVFGWLAYTYSKNIQRESSQETFHNAQFDQTHILNLVGNYKFSAVWDAGGRLLYRTGNTYTGVDDAVFNANLDKYQPRKNPSTKLYSDRLPPYNELSIYANHDFLYDTWKMAFRFGLEFFALQRPAQGVRNNYDYSKEELFRGIPPIPYIELRGIL